MFRAVPGAMVSATSEAFGLGAWTRSGKMSEISGTALGGRRRSFGKGEPLGIPEIVSWRWLFIFHSTFK